MKLNGIEISQNQSKSIISSIIARAAMDAPEAMNEERKTNFDIGLHYGLNIKNISASLYLNNQTRYRKKYNDFTDKEIAGLKRLFFDIYKRKVSERGAFFEIGDKEKNIMSTLFLWAISDFKFPGDLSKGIYFYGGQGSGKDVLLSAVVDFFNVFDKKIQEWRYPDFCRQWYEKGEYFFRRPTKINDIKEGKIKRERESYPFLELLDYREQENIRRSLLVSSNLSPFDLQDAIEDGKKIKRLEERVIECFNVIEITGVESKRVESKIII